MTEGNFTDYVKVYVRSGNGGKGSTHLHREKFVEKGNISTEIVIYGLFLCFLYYF